MTANRFADHMLPSRPQPHHAGLKRRVDDELDNQSGISTQFKKLRINHAPHRHPLLAAHHASVANPAPGPEKLRPSGLTEPHGSTSRLPQTLGSMDFMPIDETSNRIVIHDLDAEIAAIEAEEPSQNAFFLPEFDKKVSAIPQSVLQPQKDPNTSNTQLVLYRDPVSISVPEAEDAVRKAIVEARRRTRERQAIERQEARAETKVESPVQTMPQPSLWLNGHRHMFKVNDDGYEMETSERAPSHFYNVEEEDDPDAMDIG